MKLTLLSLFPSFICVTFFIALLQPVVSFSARCGCSELAKKFRERVGQSPLGKVNPQLCAYMEKSCLECCNWDNYSQPECCVYQEEKQIC
ncbi:hypothetical protein CONCODRAFT_79923 [Conidiobolus coronatus NRRL 28638]|uniref:Uncharacterized protein n=1 Tax=Conidiobolus coronatus (strain ATCC 28846 / CBS 209.66 / NRRL 28638) TaxID=796925 RepID=A0A137NZ90_CONC2|nr:hypothetical protein CONCODRAFT_79923 [Conidiobolus coronatus NRRL 28638]|eukprot:KXN68077.1 hypothetical protein CONCODRAFT_79923 [Conidiobolus coronatus NRRL 28638]